MQKLKQVKSIITADSERRYVVPSAPGKRFKEDTKVTDMLYHCYEMIAKRENIDEYCELIKARYNGIIADLGLDISLDNEFALIEAALEEGTTVDNKRATVNVGNVISSYVFISDNLERTTINGSNTAANANCTVITLYNNCIELFVFSSALYSVSQYLQFKLQRQKRINNCLYPT